MNEGAEYGIYLETMKQQTLSVSLLYVCLKKETCYFSETKK